MELIDFILHVDRHLTEFVAANGAWIYGLLFLIVFVETGLVVMPLLPGDSLLFAAGAIAATGGMDPVLLVGLLFTAAVLGDTVNYQVGHYIGPRVYERDSRFIKREHLLKTRDFFERHGGKTVIIARFMPFIRTFAPFVAGVAEMTRGKFSLFNIGGGLLWVVGLCTAGYLFGNLAFVKEHLDKIIWALIIVPGLIAIFGAWRAGRAPSSAR
jgi:membrane-associated protein